MKTATSRYFMVVGGLGLLYVLSVGPAYRMAARSVIPNAVFVTLYEPVIYVGESVPVLHGVFNWYMRLWHDYTRMEQLSLCPFSRPNNRSSRTAAEASSFAACFESSSHYSGCVTGLPAAVGHTCRSTCQCEPPCQHSLRCS